MRRAEIVETQLDFIDLTERVTTDMIVVHHTGSAGDWDAATIHQWHLNNPGWAGIGYHYVIRKDGTIERGRPNWAIGSHAYGENSHTLGIHVSGNFNEETPTSEQIETLALLIANLCADWGIEINRDNIVGHCDLMSTSCPGNSLLELLNDNTIIGKALWYVNESTDEPPKEEPPAPEPEPTPQNVETGNIYTLARKYESNGNPAAVSTGTGDLGGISYGLYQLASNVGSVQEFLRWVCDYPDSALANYGKVLSEYEVNSGEFIDKWQEIGEIDPVGFGKLQDEYIKSVYFDGAADQLARAGYHVDIHSKAMQSVILSRAVQHGATGCADLLDYACKLLGHPNLSYVDSDYFDRGMIAAIYDFLIEECNLARPDRNGIYRSPEGFCNGSSGVINGLRSRFEREKLDALEMVEVELNGN